MSDIVSEAKQVVVKAESIYAKLPKQIVAILLILLVGYGLFWYGKRTADREARIHELEVERDQLQKQAKELQGQRQVIQQSTSESVASVRQNRASIRTPQQAVEDVNANLGTHIGIDPQEHSDANVPDAPSVWKIPRKEIPLITTAITDYKVQGVQLDGCKKELGVCDEQLANRDKQIANLEQQVKEKSPKRFRNCLFSVGSNSATGAIFAKDKKTGAIGGAVVGLGACLLNK